MRKLILTFILMTLIAIICFCFSGCGKGKFVQSIEFTKNQVVDVYEDDFEFSKYTITVYYTDGTSRYVPLSEDMISPQEQTKLHKKGEWNIEIDYLGVKTVFFAKINRNIIEDTFPLEDIEIDYDGKPHIYRIDDSNIPARITVSYPNGYSFLDAGEYDYKVVFSGEGYETLTKTCKITINKVDYKINNSGRIFESGKEFYFDGSEKKVEVENLPDDLDVTYTTYLINGENEEKVNAAVNAGEYAVYAHYALKDRNNYNPVTDERITFTILKAPYNISKIKFLPKNVTYNEREHYIELEDESVLPQGVSVQYYSYRINGEELTLVENAIEAGEYKIVARFTNSDKNYQQINDIEATLTIEKCMIDMSNVRYSSQEIDFDGEGHFLYFTDELPDFVELEYLNDEEYYSKGNYEFIVKFYVDEEHSNNYYLNITELSAWLLIREVEVSIPFTTNNLVYNKNDGTYSVIGIQNGVSYTITMYADDMKSEVVEILEPSKQYYYVIEFVYDDPIKKESRLITPVEGVWSIE